MNIAAGWKLGSRARGTCKQFRALRPNDPVSKWTVSVQEARELLVVLWAVLFHVVGPAKSDAGPFPRYTGKTISTVPRWDYQTTSYVFGARIKRP